MKNNSIGKNCEISKSSIIVGIQKPFFLERTLASTNEGDYEQRVDAIQLTIGYRQILNTSIPFIE